MNIQRAGSVSLPARFRFQFRISQALGSDDMDKTQAFQLIARDVVEGHIDFPTNVQVSLRLRDALSDPDCHVDKAARLVEAEPLLAARIVALANSVAYNPYAREISDLRSAISRLGFAALRSLSMALVARQMAGGALPVACQAIADQLWQHTAHVAALSRVIARRVTGVDPEAALFAGLMHEVAGFYLLAKSPAYPGLLDGDFAEWIEVGERQVGEPLLQALAIPENVLAAIEVYWDGYLGMPPAGLGDTLLLAEQLSPVSSPLHRIGSGNKFPGIDAEIEVLVGEALLTEILAESQGEVASLYAALCF